MENTNPEQTRPRREICDMKEPLSDGDSALTEANPRATAQECAVWGALDDVYAFILWRRPGLCTPVDCRNARSSICKYVKFIQSACSPERWPSGLRRTLGKRVYFNEYRGFESHSLRHIVDTISLSFTHHSRTRKFPRKSADSAPAQRTACLSGVAHRSWPVSPQEPPQ